MITTGCRLNANLVISRQTACVSLEERSNPEKGCGTLGAVAWPLPMGSKRPYHKPSLAAASIGYDT
jgi:hypothetical protein